MHGHSASGKKNSFRSESRKPFSFNQKSGAPGGTRTLDLLVRRGIFSYTPTHWVQQEPMKSTRETESFRLVSEGGGSQGDQRSSGRARFRRSSFGKSIRSSHSRGV
jgi:hypothetical protein